MTNSRLFSNPFVAWVATHSGVPIAFDKRSNQDNPLNEKHAQPSQACLEMRARGSGYDHWLVRGVG